MPYTQKLLEAVLFSAPGPILAVDDQLLVKMVNPAAETRFSARVGQTIIDVLGPLASFPNTDITLRQSFAGATPFEFDVQVENEIYACHAAPLQGFEQGWVLLLLQTTHFKKMDDMKSRMLHMMAHDLKNPLSAIVGMTQMLIRKFGGYSERQSEYLQSIASNAMRMEALINGVLDLERIKAGHANNKQMVEAHWLFHRLVSEFEPQILAKGHTLSLNMPDERLKLFIDETQLYQALSNVLSNAIKFTPDKGQLGINVERTGNSVLVKISDNGYGIPLEMQPRVFEPFYRARSQRTVDIPGNGIGLSLVEAVVQLHGGEVWLQSQEDNGTSFFIQLPISEETRDMK